jgi:hypothetical protein
MKRKIAAFHQDELSDWVADLDCGHTQHVRHHPPFQTRPWVVSAEGRLSHLGIELDCKTCDEEPRHVTERRHLVRRYYDELWNAWDVSLADELLAPDFRFRGSLGFETRGREEFLAYLEMTRDAFPDFHNRIDDFIAEDTKVVARLTVHWHPSRPYLRHRRQRRKNRLRGCCDLLGRRHPTPFRVGSRG